MSGVWQRSQALRWGRHSCYACYVLVLVAVVIATVLPTGSAPPQALVMAGTVGACAVRIHERGEASLVTVAAVALTMALLVHSGAAIGWSLVGYQVPVVFAAFLGRSWRSNRPARS